MKKITAFSIIMALTSATAIAAETKEFELIIKDHKFSPSTIEVPAGEKVKLIVKNQDSTPEEFESHSLNREKVIPANSEAVIFINPLDAGEYKFFGEFHEKTAQGKLVAK